MGRIKMLLDGPYTLCLVCTPPALAGVFTTPTEDEVDVDNAMDSGGVPSIYLLTMYRKQPQATGSPVTQRILYLKNNKSP